jgi:hypothetical protein
MPDKTELQNNYIAVLWRRYKPFKGRDDPADLIFALIRKLIIEGARNSRTVAGANGYRIRCGRMESLKLNTIHEI